MSKPDIKNICDNCKWFNDWGLARVDTSDGDCRRHALVTKTIPHLNLDGKIIEMDITTCFPLVKFNDWCGDYEVEL